MKDLSHEALISAYFDGEASPAQCAEVERLLRENPETSIALEELRELSVQIQSLPTFELEPDFHEAVIRKAERAMLLDKETHDNEKHVGQSDVKHADGNGKASHPSVLPFTQRSKSVRSTSAAAVRQNGSLRNTPVPSFVAAKQGWNAPVGLAAAASLFLFIGLIAFANRQGSRPNRIVDRGTFAEVNKESGTQKNASGLADLREEGGKLLLREAENRAIKGGSPDDLDILSGSNGKSRPNGYFERSAAKTKGEGKARLAVDPKENAGGGATFAEKDAADRPAMRPLAIKLLNAETGKRRDLSGEKQDFSSGPALVVCDVQGNPEEVYCLFEAVLLERQIVNRRVLLTDERQELADKNARKNKDRGKDKKSAQSRQSQLAAISSRLYLVDVTPDQFAAALRGVNTLNKLEISISSLKLPHSDRSAGFASTVQTPAAALKTVGKSIANAPSRRHQGKKSQMLGRPTKTQLLLLESKTAKSRFRADALDKQRKPKNPGETPTAVRSTIFVLRVTRPVASAKKSD